MARTWWTAGCAFLALACAGADAAFSSPAVTNVASFVVQVTNHTTFAMMPTNLFPVAEAASLTNAAALASGTNAVPAVLPTEAETNLIRKAALDAVADAVKAVNEASDKSMAAERSRRISTRTFKLQHARAEDVAQKFNGMWSGDFGLPWKLTKMAQAFPEANSVMVTAPGLILDACEQAVREIDIEPRQVYIEARFVELGNTAMHKLGIDWSMLEGMKGSASFGGGLRAYNIGQGVEEFKRTINAADGTTSYSLVGGTKTSGSGTFKGGSDGSISYFNGTLDFGQMYLVLSALERENDSRIFSNPKIIVSNGHKAVVDMTTKYPNVTVSAKRTMNGNSESLDLAMNMAAIPGEDNLMFAKEAFFSWGISLEVTPNIVSNDMISVSIVPTISSLDTSLSPSGFVTAGEEESDSPTYSSKYPIINVQRLVTDFALKSGMTAVIGGLSRTVEEQVDSGIPWLRDWPWVGDKLFGGKSRQKVQKEIIVFVTVGLAEPGSLPADAGLPKNAVLGREYVNDIRREPGDRRSGSAGVSSLDLRSLEAQAADPRRTNRTERADMKFQLPFTKKR